ncbi:LysR family transcriptional regulator [Phreatobacter sp.]|uniref:LysR family transcriptional regulator n=1 Tax=Phreatobacter sp. TaxID=1966341 RepID=UPI003F7198FF
MDLDAFRLFCAVVDRGSIAAAARECGLSPSMASRRITALEEAIGARLLLRTTRSLAPTEAGLTLLSWARGALLDWNRMRDEIGAMQGQASGLVRLATNDYAASAYLPTILASFARLQPDVRVAVSIAQEPARLLDGMCDLAVHAGRRPDADLVGRKIYEYGRKVVASPAYLDGRDTPLKPADIARHLCLTHNVSEPAEWTFEDPDGVLHVQRVHSHMSCDSWTMLLALALQGIGIARLSDSLVRGPLADGRLVELLPHMRSVYADGDPPAMWVLAADRAMPLRVRLLADHIASALLQLHRTGRR